MSLTRLLITSVVVENRSVRDVAKTYGVSQSWLYELLARYRREGEAVFEPRSQRPKSSPTALAGELVDLLVELREKLSAAGLDAGPGHDQLAPEAPPRHDRVPGHHRPLPNEGGPGRAGPAEAAQVVLHPVRRA